MTATTTPSTTNNYARLENGQLIFFDDTRPGVLARVAERLEKDDAPTLFRDPPLSVVEQADVFAKTQTKRAGVAFSDVKLITPCSKGRHRWPETSKGSEHCKRCSIQRRTYDC